MNYYFQLQLKRLHRWFQNTSIHPIIGWFLMVVLFIGLSIYLFEKTGFAPWLYIIIAFSIMSLFGKKEKTHRLKVLYNRATFFKIRMIENYIIALPFLIFLLIKQELLPSILLLLAAPVVLFSGSKSSISRVFPTPFKKFPFEHIVGFRRSALFILGIYLLSFQAIQVDNYNLSLVSLGLLFVTVMAFYMQPEDRYFVWIFAKNPSSFLRKKTLDSLICSAALTLPMTLLISFWFPENILMTLGILALGFVFIFTIILAKYTAFPYEMSVTQGIYFTLCLSFPPLLLIIIPLFYKQSKEKLNLILND